MTQQSILKEDTLLKIGGVGLIVGAILMVISTIWLLLSTLAARR